MVARRPRQHLPLLATAIVAGLLAFGTGAVGPRHARAAPLTPVDGISVQAGAGASSQAQSCGSVTSLGGHVTSSGADVAENCFVQAYQSCSPASLTATINGVDAGTTHIFSLSGSPNNCTITDVAQTRVIPRPPGPQRTYTCAGLEQTSDGLAFSSCGDLGDVIVPAPGS